MLSMRGQFAFLLAVVSLFWLQAGSWAQNPQGQEQKIATWLADPSTALAHVPEGQVIVTYENSELTIIAKSVPLRRVLQEVCAQMGVALDFSPGADEPIFAVLGPGPAKKVIVSLLDESQFNYVTALAVDDPNALARVIVFPQSKDSKLWSSVEQDSVSQGQATSAIMAMVDSVATDANSPWAGQQTGAAASPNPVGRPRHRRR